jgi:hypothetical protein
MLTSAELDSVPQFLVWLAWGGFVIGGFICVLNFRIFMDWVIYRLRRLPEESRKNVSAIPILGSLIVALMLRTLGSIPAAKVVGIVLIVIDMGGIHWAVVGIVYQIYLAIRRRM